MPTTTECGMEEDELVFSFRNLLPAPFLEQT